MKKHILTSCIFHFTFCISYAQSGSLDNSFGIAGRVITDFGNAENFGSAIVLQNDGKIIVAGETNNGGPSFSDFALVRYNSDGSLDNTFGTGGKVATDFISGTGGDEGFAVALQSDGKIAVVGYTHNTNDDDFAIARYNSNGSLDNTFGTGGKVITPVGNSDDIGLSVAIQNDGKIIAAGTSSNGSNRDLALVRYNSNGSLDNTFGIAGKVTTVIVGQVSVNCSVAIQSDGKIVMTGADGDFVLVRYNSNGSLDNTFGSGGIVTTTIGTPTGSTSNSLALQTDGKIVLAGSSFNGSQDVFALARYDTNGSLDNTFGTSGIVMTALGSHQDDGYSLTIQNDGKIIAVGFTNPTGIYVDGDLGLVRYNTNGSLDISFAIGGIDTTSFGMASIAKAVAVQSDGKIVVAGTKYNPGYDAIAIARYNNTVLSAIAESGKELEVMIYPNPSNGIFTCNLKNKFSETTICIRDVLGNCLINEDHLNDPNPKIDLSDQPKGIYFMEIISDGERTVKKIILE